MKLDAGTILSIITVLVTLWGLREWRRQKQYDVHFDIARRFAALAFKFDELFPNAQNPWGPYVHEYEDRPRSSEETPDQAKLLDSQYGHMTRLEPLRLTILEMRELNWESKATIGLDFQPYITKYINMIAELKEAIRMLFDPRLQKYLHAPGHEARLDKYEESQNVLYGGPQGKVLRQQVRQATEELTEYLATYTFKGHGFSIWGSPLPVREQLKKAEPAKLQILVRDLENKLEAARKHLSEIEGSSTTSETASQNPLRKSQSADK